jgi:hypothetical protein
VRRALVIWITLLAFSTPAVKAQLPTSVTSEERDAALGYIASANFLVGRIGRDCLTVLGRKESPQDFARSWQARNSPYVMAAAKYMELKLNEVLVSGGPERKDAVLREMQSKAQASVDGMLQQWFRERSKEEVCKRSVGLVDAGAFDISPSTPMFKELQALVAWAK